MENHNGCGGDVALYFRSLKDVGIQSEVLLSLGK